MEHVELTHYNDVPSRWPWPHFSPREVACKGTGRVKVHIKSMNALEAFRRELGRPVYLTSAYRSPVHNAAVGGAPNSMHLRGQAFDVQVRDNDPAEIERAARRAGFTGFGFYQRQGFIHIDTGRAREWGKRWW